MVEENITPKMQRTEIDLPRMSYIIGEFKNVTSINESSKEDE
jgi:hypothetical protein